MTDSKASVSNLVDQDESKSDPSLLKQISALQLQNQELLQSRSELEKKLEANHQEFETLKENFAKERAELVEVQRKEMQTQFENFMQDWIASMEKENPEVVSKMKTGVERMIDEGRSKDSVWEVLCCASKAHKINVNTIEELTKTNTALSDRNKELEELSRKSDGFDNESSRIGNKRTRVEDTNAPIVNETPRTQHAESDVWGAFESFMHTQNSRTVY